MNAILRGNSIYAKSARFDVARPLNEDELRAVAPSIFATEAHESRSERFAPIPTFDVLRALEKEGFFPVAAKQSVTRDEGKAPFTKHLIRLRRFDNVEAYKVNDTVAEIILKNANDGTSAYDLMCGLFRILCMNSLVAKTQTLDSVKVRHSGNAIENVIEGTYRVLSESQRCLAAPQDWSAINTSQEARDAFAEAAHVLRFGETDDNAPPAIQPRALLAPRRSEDRAQDFWTIFNVVQENAIRGGLHGVRRDAINRRRRVTTRPVNGIDQDVKLNKALWVLGERMASILKNAA